MAGRFAHFVTTRWTHMERSGVTTEFTTLGVAHRLVSYTRLPPIGPFPFKSNFQNRHPVVGYPHGGLVTPC
jgi:hypothetical protein